MTELDREQIAAVFRERLHGSPLSQCKDSDTCADDSLAYELADLVLEQLRKP